MFNSVVGETVRMYWCFELANTVDLLLMVTKQAIRDCVPAITGFVCNVFACLS